LEGSDWFGLRANRSVKGGVTVSPWAVIMCVGRRLSSQKNIDYILNTAKV